MTSCHTQVIQVPHSLLRGLAGVSGYGIGRPAGHMGVPDILLCGPGEQNAVGSKSSLAVSGFSLLSSSRLSHL